MAIDQGTTSSRAILFDHAGEVVGTGQREHEQHFPRAGWVEHDAAEIRDNVIAVIAEALDAAGASAADVAAIGITNQRETAVVWDRATGEPISPAIVWQDTRTQDLVDALAADGGPGRFQRADRPPARDLLLGHQDRLDPRQRRGRPGARRGRRARLRHHRLLGALEPHGRRRTAASTPPTSRTPAARCSWTCAPSQWDDALLDAFGIPRALLPEIRSSSEVYGEAAASTPLPGVPIAGILGDQQAATFGQAAFDAGESKNTYGTGNFLIFNTGTEIMHSRERPDHDGRLPARRRPIRSTRSRGRSP